MTDQGPDAPPPAEPNSEAPAPVAPTAPQRPAPIDSGFAAQPAPPYAQPYPPVPQPIPMPYPNAQQPGYARQPIYAQPPASAQPPIDAYSRSPFAAPYAAPPVAGYQPRQPAPAGSSTLGAVAFILSLLAAVVAPIVASFAGWAIGAGLGAQQVSDLSEANASSSAMLAALTPVRGQVLVAEIAFWAGTVLGIWAIVQGIVAIAKRRGRGFGVAAIVVAAVGPLVFFVMLLIFLGMGAAGAVPPNA